MAKIGRNMPCPCGSGRKYKKCCLAQDTAAARREQAEKAQREDILPEADALPGFGSTDLSPEDWRTLAQRLPKSLRAEAAPLVEQIAEFAEFQAKLPEITAAQEVLETYRGDFERLTDNPTELLERAEQLFAEPPFDAMRFSVSDLSRAFEAVGYPPATRDAERFVKLAERVCDFLLDDEQRYALARRLVCLLPDYVANERYLDAWIIQHSFFRLTEPRQQGCSPFLLCLFLQAVQAWGKERDRDQAEVFDQLGLAPETIREQGYEGLETMLRDVGARPGAMEAVERFLDSHPQLAAQMQARCCEAEDAAIELLHREEGQSLLLDDAEIEPWLHVFSDRMTDYPELGRALLENQALAEDQKRLLMEILCGIAEEMSAAIFSEERLRKLHADVDALRRQFEQEGRNESMAMAISGLLLAASVSTPPQESLVINRLCLFSLMQAGRYVRDSA
jgi:hypothetical protein